MPEGEQCVSLGTHKHFYGYAPPGNLRSLLVAGFHTEVGGGGGGGGGGLAASNQFLAFLK